MQTIKYLKENGIESLKEELGIIVKEYDDLLVLNYSQIESPKTHPIVRECRGLILDKDFNVVSRKLCRFFNYGEAPDTMSHLNFSKAVVYEKIDGSLIGIFNYNGHWYVATRGTAFAEAETAWGGTFKDLVYEALNVDDDEHFNEECNIYLNPEYTYIFEVTSPHNRVVVRHTETRLTLLTSRHNETGEYGGEDQENDAFSIGADVVKKYSFDSVEHCIEAARNLPNLEEGYVVYQDNEPVCKIKSPAYLAAHTIRGEGLTPRSAMELVLEQDHEEYLAYFEEDRPFFEKYITGYDDLREEMNRVFENVKGIEDQKEFALAVKDYVFSDAMFKSKKSGEHPFHYFNSREMHYRLKVFKSWMGEA